MFDLLSKRNVEKIQKYGIFCYFSPIFSTTEHLTKKILIFFSKPKILFVDNESAKFHKV